MGKIQSFFDKILNVVVVVCVITMVAVIFLQVIFRFVLNNPLSWTEELARYLFVWITFLGAAICAREKGHIGMDFLVSKLPDNYAKIVEKLGLLLIIAVSVIIMVTSIEIVKMNFGQRSPALKLNMGFVYSAIPIGFAYSSVYYIKHLFARTKGSEEERVC